MDLSTVGSAAHGDYDKSKVAVSSATDWGLHATARIGTAILCSTCMSTQQEQKVATNHDHSC